MNYSKEIRRLIRRIPTDFPCMEGCVLCCNKHRWTWTEWAQVSDKRVALDRESKCPYACDDGCSVYEQRPVICRLYGNSLATISYGRFKNIPIACPLEIQPFSPLSRQEVNKLFAEYMEIIKKEEIDGLNSDHCTLPAGPFGAFIRPDAGVVVLGGDND